MKRIWHWLTGKPKHVTAIYSRLKLLADRPNGAKEWDTDLHFRVFYTDGSWVEVSYAENPKFCADAFTDLYDSNFRDAPRIHREKESA